MKRRKLIALIGVLAIAWPLASYAQQPNQPLKRVGVLAMIVPCPLQRDNPFVRRLGELGWIEGQTIVFECVSTVGRLDQLSELARELVSRRPDVLMAIHYALVRALKQETTTIPIVMLGGGLEPVRLGLINNLAHPGGNVTGVAWFNLLHKQLELLKEIVPNLRRVANIFGPPGPVFDDGGSTDENWKNAAGKLGITWQDFSAAVENDYDEIFARLAAEHFDAAYIPGTPLNVQNATRICQLVLRHRIPAVSEAAGWAKCGFLLTYGQNFTWAVEHSMNYVDKILRGAKPGDLPVEQATNFELVVNLKTANTLGLTVPPSLIARADEVIE
jgi:putative tryptophan/tyrosine transport system substrate-binding protein